MSVTPPQHNDPQDDLPMKGYERYEEEVESAPEKKSYVWSLLFAVVLTGAIGHGFYSRSLSNRLAEMESVMETRLGSQEEMIQGLQDQVSMSDQYFAALRSELDSTKDQLGNTQGELRTTRQVANRLVRQQQDSTRQLVGQLGQLQQEQATTKGTVGNLSTDVNAVKGDVSGVRQEVGAAKQDVASTRLDLQRVAGDLGAQTGLIARNREELAELRLRGERDYFEFDLGRARQPRRFGPVGLLLRRTDVKRQRYTLELIADDYRVEKKDRNVNEPVQFYQEGHRLPSEIVVNQIHKDRIVGYVAIPKKGTAQLANQASDAGSVP